MTEYDNTNRGVLFKNDRKDSEKHPAYKGSINVSGKDYWLSAWIKEGAKGTFMSLSVQEKDMPSKPQDNYNRASAGASNRQAPSDADDGLDIPF